MAHCFLFYCLSMSVAYLARRAALLLAICLLWPLLAASALLSQACREDNAGYVIRQTVSRDVQSNGVAITVPAGVAVAWSCVSRNEAEQELARQIATIGGTP